MCKMELRDAYFSVPLNQDSQKFVQFQWSEKIYEFVCLFWFRACSQDFYKVIKNTHFHFEQTRHYCSHLFGRHVSDGAFKGGGYNGQRYSEISSSVSGVCIQLEKICFDSSTKDRVLRDDSRFKEYDFIITTGEIRQNQKSVFGNTVTESGDSLRTNSSVSSPLIDNTGDITSSYAIPTSSESTNFCFKTNKVLHRQSY